MRSFIVRKKVDRHPVSMVFHDYKEGVYYCRSKSEVFLNVFDLVLKKSVCRFAKDGGRGYVVDYNEFEYDWVDSILGSIDLEFYDIEEVEQVPNIEHRIDDLVEKYM